MIKDDYSIPIMQETLDCLQYRIIHPSGLKKWVLAGGSREGQHGFHSLYSRPPWGLQI